MEFFEPRIALMMGIGGAIVGSERVRHAVGRGVGYAARGVTVVAGPIARPVMRASEDLVDEARRTAAGDGTTKAAA
jgi:hypothetical protein